jgi:hypothetical protein
MYSPATHSATGSPIRPSRRHRANKGSLTCQARPRRRSPVRNGNAGRQPDAVPGAWFGLVRVAADRTGHGALRPAIDLSAVPRHHRSAPGHPQHMTGWSVQATVGRR